MRARIAKISEIRKIKMVGGLSLIFSPCKSLSKNKLGAIRVTTNLEKTETSFGWKIRVSCAFLATVD